MRGKIEIEIEIEIGIEMKVIRDRDRDRDRDGDRDEDRDRDRDRDRDISPASVLSAQSAQSPTTTAPAAAHQQQQQQSQRHFFKRHFGMPPLNPPTRKPMKPAEKRSAPEPDSATHLRSRGAGVHHASTSAVAEKQAWDRASAAGGLLLAEDKKRALTVAKINEEVEAANERLKKRKQELA